MSVPSDNQFLDFDVAVIGGGPVGLAAAIALRQAGARTALVARQMPYADNRTTALLGDSVAFLQSLGVWAHCQAHSASMQVMRLVDDTGRLIRAPDMRFSSDELGLEAFGHNIANRDLLAAMEVRASETGLVRIDSEASAVACTDTAVEIRCRNGVNLSARIVAGADGRNSLCRTSAGIDMTFRALKQSALTCNVTHSRPHNNISTEFHTAHGPCVFVPLAGNRSSVVWVMPPDRAGQLAKATIGELSAAIEIRSHFHLGSLTADEERHVFPLAFGQTRTIAAQRIALVGEAAHVLPPIGAQGLNLGLRDAEAIGRMVRDAITSGEDVGGSSTLDAYSRERHADIAKRSLVVGVANQSLLSNFLPAQIIRAAGMHLMNASAPLRRFVMRQAASANAVHSAELTTEDVIAGRSVRS